MVLSTKRELLEAMEKLRSQQKAVPQKGSLATVDASYTSSVLDNSSGSHSFFFSIEGIDFNDCSLSEEDTERVWQSTRDSEMSRPVSAISIGADPLSEIDNEDSPVPNHCDPKREDFPVDYLPGGLGRYVKQVAWTCRCDDAYAALPLLSAMATSVGNSLTLQIKRTWKVPSILWCCVVGSSGAGKSTPPKIIFEALDKYDNMLVKKNEREKQTYEQQLQIYNKEKAIWRKSKTKSDPPTPPTKPICHQVKTNDGTIEGIQKLLQENPKGILYDCDELAGWFKGFGRYSKGNSSSEPFWLSMYGASRCVINRASGQRTVIQRASVNLFGTTQPGILKTLLTPEYMASGLAARLLFTTPPREIKTWSEEEIDEKLQRRVGQMLMDMLSIPMIADEEGYLAPQVVLPSREAKSIYIEYYNSHNRASGELTDERLESAYSKLEETPLRIALIIHAARYVLNQVSELKLLDAESMRAGIAISEWFKKETELVYARLGETKEQQAERLFVDWIRRRGGTVTARDVQRSGRSGIKTSEQAEMALKSLASRGLGLYEQRQDASGKGRPTWCFTLTVQ